MHARAGVQIQDGESNPVGPATVYGMEVTRPYQHVSQGPTRALTVMIPADAVDLPLKCVAPARAQLNASPLRGLFLHHVQTMAVQADRPARPPQARTIESATLQADAGHAARPRDGGRDSGGRSALEDTLFERVQLHIRQHERDPNLVAASIAAAHHVSVRHLYKVCADHERRLEQWIIRERLAGARAELAEPASRRRTIAATATSWGFANASHFTHRFREASWTTPLVSGRTSAISRRLGEAGAANVQPGATTRARTEHPHLANGGNLVTLISRNRRFPVLVSQPGQPRRSVLKVAALSVTALALVSSGAVAAAPAGVASLPSAAVAPAASRTLAAKPTVVLVHGAFADASGWNDVIAGLQKRRLHRARTPEPAARADRRR